MCKQVSIDSAVAAEFLANNTDIPSLQQFNLPALVAYRERYPSTVLSKLISIYCEAMPLLDSLSSFIIMPSTTTTTTTLTEIAQKSTAEKLVEAIKELQETSGGSEQLLAALLYPQLMLVLFRRQQQLGLPRKDGSSVGDLNGTVQAARNSLRLLQQRQDQDAFDCPL